MQSEHKIKTLVIGTLISLASAILIIPGIFVQGYLVRVVRHGANQTGTLPEFEEWGRLAVDGLKMGVAFVVYYFSFFLLLILGVVVPSFVFASGTPAAGSTTGSAAGGAAGAASGGPGLLGIAFSLLFVALAVGALYFGLVGMVSYAASDNLVNAFNPKVLLSVGFSLPFFVAALLATIVVLVLSLVSTLLTLIIVGLLGFFYAQIVFYYILGQGYTAAGGTVASVS